eukprot:Anaeramoba_ignava/a350689_25.p1 GENE.a350689_25~~a350689_25.p1  ORF type:complete len:215 (+),score=-23.03 a350689_25:1-645(+)
MVIEKLIKGNKKFKDSKFLKLESKFNDLVQYGQKPEILFIGCSDSRVVPDLIVNAKPGDMFILRNIGNFVPPYKPDNDYHGSSAAIEYAVSALGVKDIIVCGHSHCGACASLYEDLSDKPSLIHVHKWLKLGERAKIEAKNALKKKDKGNMQKLLRLTEKASIKHQLENLLTYPEVRKKVKKGKLDLHGWYYKIEDGTIEYYDGKSDSFKTLGK